MTSKISWDSLEIADRLHSTAIHLLRKLRREDARTGLNTPRLSALSVIVFAGPIALGQLAAAEQVRPPTMTRIVKALVAMGLATRRRNPEDARSVQIAATSAGKRLMMRGRERRVRALAAQVDRLTQHERSTLRQAEAIISRVVTAM